MAGLEEFDYSTVTSAVAVAMTAIADDSSSDDEPVNTTLTPRKLPKSRHYFEQIEKMDDAEFFSHFRLSRGKFFIFYRL